MDSHLGKIELKLPKLSLGGGIENKEVPGKYDVDLVGEIKVAFDPLLELDFEIDILNWLIAFLGPGLGTFLLKIKDEAQKGVGSCSEDGKEKKFGMAANVNINLTANGKIKGSAIWKKEIDGDWNFDGKTVTSLTLALSGNAGGYVKAFHIQAGGGAYTYAETGFELILKPGAVYCENSKRHLPGITIQTGFRGLTIYYIYYRDYSYSNSLTPTRSAEPPSNSEIKRKISVEHKYMKSAVIIHEKLWPSKPWTVPISSGVI